MPRSIKKNQKAKRKKHRELMKKIRQDIAFRAVEQKADKESHRRARKDQNRRKTEQKADTEAHRNARKDENRRKTEQKADTEAHRSARKDENRRKTEQKADTEAHRKAREDKVRRKTEQRADTDAHRKARKDENRRKIEQQADTEAHRKARKDDERRKTEQKVDTESHRRARKDQNRRETEQKANTEAHRKAREDVNRRTAEQKSNTEAHKKARQEPDKRIPGKLRDSSARKIARQNPLKRLAENEVDIKRRSKIRKLNQSRYEILLQDYNKEIRQAPTFICSSCGGLFYKNKTTMTSEEALKKKGCTEDFIQSILNVPQNQHRLCHTCKLYVYKQRIPRLSLSNGFKFPEIPDVLKELSPLEERLVALRLPFMQIRLMGSEQQSVLRGNVVNVENDLDVCAKVLPRRFDETSTVLVQLMRRMQYRKPYMYARIRPQKVQQAVEYLLSTELYQSENVVLSEDWSSLGDSEIDFIYPGNDQTLEESNNQPLEESNGQSDITIDDIEDAANHQNASFGAEETLVFRDNDLSFAGIRIAPAEGKTPIPLHRDEHAEILSFPTVYAGVKRNFKNNMKVSYTDISKSELRRYDRRACKATKILYSFSKSYKEKLRQAMQVCMRKKKGTKRLTAGNLKTPGFYEKLVKKDEGFPLFPNLRSSPSYWKEKTKKVLAMIRQLGKCTFFITLSAAETKWQELIVILMKVVKNTAISEVEASSMSFMEIAELIRTDPVTCMIHFDHKYRALLNILLNKPGGIFSPYVLTDFFSRYEYQVRGSPHSHGLYWIQNAPMYDENDSSSEKQCVDFIDKFITCERCEEGKMEKLIGYQIHNHSRTCEKKYKQGIQCRFGFPKPPFNRTIILKPLPRDIDQKMKKQAAELYAKIQDKLNEMGRTFKQDIPYNNFLAYLGVTELDYLLAVRSSIKRATVFLKRSTNAIFVNGYNRQLLEAWEANMDIQFILDVYSCAKYCVGYVLKSEGGVSKLLQAANQDARKGNKSIQTKLKQFANILINGSEISAQEAASFLLGMGNTVSSRTDIFINTAPPEERVGFLKTMEELNELGDDSEDICAKGLLDHYSQRPEELENICLAKFAAMYNFTKAQKKAKEDMDENDADTEFNEQIDFINWQDFNAFESSSATQKTAAKNWQLLDKSGCVTERRKPKIIRFRHYGKMQDPHNYNREQIMLFAPWRDEQAELLSIDPIMKAEELKALITKNSFTFYANRDVDDEALIDVLNQIESNEIENEEQNNTQIQNEFSLQTDDASEQNENFVKDIVTGISTVEQFLPPRHIPENEYNQVMLTLNDRQLRFVLNTLHLLKTTDEPFYFFLSGGAGVGKSHAITAVVQSFLRFTGNSTVTHPDQVCVLVSAPTGKAAFNVFGMTLHSTFKLPPNQYSGKMCDLDDGSVNTLRMKLCNVKLFIIDEISMVSVRQLYDIDQRLRQVFFTHKDFGGKSIIVAGHLRQLPPVAGKYVFKTPNHLPLGECVGNHLWHKFTFYEFDEIMRQKGDSKFCKALNNMSEGCMDADDVALIQTRQIDSINKPPDDCIKLFRTNAECQQYNSEIHQLLNTQGAVSIAFDKIQGNGSEAQKIKLLDDAKNLTQVQSDGLPYKTHLQVGGEYFVTTNIDVPDGLFNGSTGCLKYIEFGKTCKNEWIPKTAWLDFRNPLIGSQARSATKSHQESKNINLNWTGIGRTTRNLSKIGRQRNLDVVRTQIPIVAANGMTINKAQGSSLPVVTVSVQRNLSRQLLYVACSRATSSQGLYIDGNFEPPNAPAPDDSVSLEMTRLRTVPIIFTLDFLQNYGEEYQKLYFHNVQSFLLHHKNVLSDHCAMSSNYLVFLEPHLLSSDNFSVPNFNCLHRTNCRRVRNSEGALLLGKIGYVLPVRPTIDTTFSSRSHCVFLKWKVSDINILTLYKSPKYSVPAFLKQLRMVLSGITGNILVMGDININLQSNSGESVLKLFQDFNLKSKLNLAYPTTNYGTHIDCCFSNVVDLHAWLYESYYSYHKPICVVWPKTGHY